MNRPDRDQGQTTLGAVMPPSPRWLPVLVAVLVAALVVVGVSGLFTLVASATAAATPVARSHPAPPVGLSVGLSDGRTQVHSDLGVIYTATLSNGAAKPVTADLLLTVPAYLTIRAAGGAKITKQNATWPVTVEPGETVSKSLSAHIGTIPKTERRLTSLITVYQGAATDRPVIRSAAVNTIAGVGGPAQGNQPVSVRHTSTRAHNDSDARWLVLIAIAAVLVLAAACFIWLRRRRETAPAAAQTATDASEDDEALLASLLNETERPAREPADPIVHRRTASAYRSDADHDRS